MWKVRSILLLFTYDRLVHKVTQSLFAKTHMLDMLHHYYNDIITFLLYQLGIIVRWPQESKYSKVSWHSWLDAWLISKHERNYSSSDFPNDMSPYSIIAEFHQHLSKMRWSWVRSAMSISLQTQVPSSQRPSLVPQIAVLSSWVRLWIDDQTQFRWT